MKKLLIVMMIAFAANYAQAQKLNQDTLAKYSRKAEQIKVFNKVAADIHLDASQTEKFTKMSAEYSDKAIAIVKETKTAQCDKIMALKQTLKSYIREMRQVLSREQLAMLRHEREKYHFGRRFVTFND